MIAAFCLGAANSNLSTQTSDLVQDALDSIGFTYDDLGFHPKGYWSRYPMDIPYKLKMFDDLFAEPLKLYEYGLSFGEAVRRYCDPGRIDSLNNNLYNLLYYLGVEKKTGGLRSWGSNLSDSHPPEPGQTPFIDAIERLYAAGLTRTHYSSFNRAPDPPDLRSKILPEVEMLPPTTRAALAGLLDNLREAYHWREIAVRNISDDTKNQVFYIRDLSETQADGNVYYPQIDDAASAIDFESLCYSALKTAEAVERAEKELLPTLEEIPTNYNFDLETPFGRIIINGSDDHIINADDCFLIIECGGNDNYTGSIGATSRPDRGLAVVLDLAGNDTYENDDILKPSMGCGILGVGLLYDANGDDKYTGKVFAQGAGFLGIGMLFDKSGKDIYHAETSAQGAGYFGIGLVVDVSGNDDYYLFGDGQGMGGIGGGIGVLADYSGDDKYTAEPSAEVTDRGDYHSEYEINANNAQGGGFGRRGDGSDGHSWAGGLGALVDIKGNDKYLSGNWSLGIGYWFGTGICYDGEGDDEYRSVYFTQASGAHFCNGVLIDEAGNDKHILTETAGAALAFGWDFTNALFVDRGGDDEYQAKIISYGLAQIRSFAFFFEAGGNDKYTYNEGQQGFGGATFRNDFARPSALFNYTFYTKSAGIFIDTDGNDDYSLVKEDGTRTTGIYDDNSIWYSPARDDPNFGFNNFGIGIDATEGDIPLLKIFDEQN